MNKTFLQNALDAALRGITVIPLQPESKRPVESTWQTSGYTTKEQLEILNQQNPAYNVGALTSKNTTWIFDVDVVKWFMECFDKDLLGGLANTFCVKTGRGGYQYHFLQDDYSRSKLSNKNIPNPNQDKYVGYDGSVKKNVADILFDRKQGLLPGSIHPDTKKEYTVFQEKPLTAAPKEFVDWIVDQTSKNLVERIQAEKSAFLLSPGWSDPGAKLKDAGLKFEMDEKDGKMFFNYHSLMKTCLVKGEPHGELSNNKQSAFVYDPKIKQLWHQCLSDNCAPGIQNTKKALAQLNINYREVFVTEGRIQAGFIDYSDIRMEREKYLWEGYIPEGQLVHFMGPSSQGKSPITMDLAARVSSGLDWPDGAVNNHGPKKVVILAEEDNPATTLIPRLTVAGATLSNIKGLVMTRTVGTTDQEKSIALDEDLMALSDLLRTAKGLGMVIIDPITNYLGKLSMNKEEDIRSILMPLSKLAQELKITIITVGHMNKREAATPIERTMGAPAFIGVSRAAYMFGFDPEEDSKFAHIMARLRNSTTKSLKYNTITVPLPIEGELSNVIKIEWNGTSEMDANDLTAVKSHKEKGEEQKAAECLKAFLLAGMKPASECHDHLADNGYPLQAGKTKGLNPSKVRKRVGVETKRDAGLAYWFLTTTEADVKPEDVSFDTKEMF